jgi:hypothetical protein
MGRMGRVICVAWLRGIISLSFFPSSNPHKIWMYSERMIIIQELRL